MTLTQWIIASVTVIILIIDVFLALTKGKEQTISVAITNWSKQYPIIPFVFGLLMGHFFAQNNC